MRKYMLCLMLGLAAGCAEDPASDSATAAAPESSETVMENAVALVKFTCPSMH